MSSPSSRLDPEALAGITLQWFNDHAAEGIFTTDTTLRILSWNQWLRTATGVAPDAAVGRLLFDVVPSLRERGFESFYDEALSGEIKILSYALHRFIVPSVRSGAAEQMPQSGRVAPLIDDGRVVGTITVIVDVSERIAAERALRAQIASAEQARATAEQASRVKDEFLATLSHEIRTPLNAVLGWTRILRSREPDREMVARAIEVIERNATAQLTLISDMLDMARITAGKERLDVIDVDLCGIIRAAADVVRPAADAKNITVVTDLAPDAPLVRGDTDRLLQVFWNLLSNAVKFTDDSGTITIRLVVEPKNVHVSITDTGQGIAADFIPQIFQRFKQADPSAARRHGGLGLGLALVREIVQMHGGSVDVHSRGLQTGTTFTVTLPVRSAVVRTGANEARRRHENQLLLDGVHILVLEDDPDALEIVSTTITDAGASVIAVSSVPEALGTLRNAHAGRPQVVVADIGLPGADGYTFLSELRRMPPELGGNIPVIAVTAYATAEDRRNALRAGFYAHLPKPFVPEKLISTIARAVATVP